MDNARSISGAGEEAYAPRAVAATSGSNPNAGIAPNPLVNPATGAIDYTRSSWSRSSWSRSSWSRSSLEPVELELCLLEDVERQDRPDAVELEPQQLVDELDQVIPNKLPPTETPPTSPGPRPASRRAEDV